MSETPEESPASQPDAAPHEEHSSIPPDTEHVLWELLVGEPVPDEDADETRG